MGFRARKHGSHPDFVAPGPRRLGDRVPLQHVAFAEKENERLETLHRQASEKAALQEYYQAHGVRPANMAELQLLEAERQRQENAERQASGERRRAEEAQQRWEEESRRIGDQVTRDRIQAEEQSREEHQRLKFEAERLVLEISETKDDRERRRLELQLRQLKERMKAQ